MDRVSSSYEPRYHKFLLHTKNYAQQYNQYYLTRLNLMKEHMRHQVNEAWGKSCNLLNKIIDIESVQDSATESVLIGMLFKDMKLRASILDDVKDISLISTTTQPHLTLASNNDSLILEDNSGRVALTGKIKSLVPVLVTGIIVAIKGTLSETGEFIVSDWLFSHEIIEIPQPKTVVIPPVEGKFVLFLSGLEMDNSGVALQLLANFICGRSANNFLNKLASRITRIIICGRSIDSSDTHIEDESNNSTHNQQLAHLNSTKQLDLWLAQILTCCNVDMLPGSMDPVNVTLPQQPLHPCLFHHSARFNSFGRVTNPCEMKIDDVTILGHSGLPVHDIARVSYEEEVATNDSQELDHTIMAGTSVGENDEEIITFVTKAKLMDSQFSDHNRRLKILRRTMEWGHMCPTSPDVTPCYPYVDQDPFIISGDDIPDIFFCGNQPGYASELIRVRSRGKTAKDVRLVCIPRFNSNRGVLCDISNSELPCFPIDFGHI